MATPDDALKADLQKQGYQVTTPENPEGYSFEASKGGERVAVLLKTHRAKVNVATVQKFQEYLELDGSKRFTGGGWIISASGYYGTVQAHVATEEPTNLRLGTFEDGTLEWIYATNPPAGVDVVEKPTRPQSKAKLRYFGVFTCKGGVGKTTVAAHLAGAFALMGFDVILVDLDPDKNLRKLFLRDPKDDDGDASLFIPARRGVVGAAITVLNHDQWSEKDYPDVKIVVCDCSPVLSENPKDLVAKFDYCVIPTTLNPLGVAKKADVITRTFGQIREMNPRAEMFALINGYDAASDTTLKTRPLLDRLKEELDRYTSQDSKCQFIDPENAKIRYSSALYYWGMHIVTGKPPELAFKETAGRSYPRTDFLQLAEYLVHHTEINALKRHEA